MESYLLGRSPFVRISNAKYDTLRTNCGSVLGPLLFPVYVNVIPKNIKSISFFADDTVVSYCSKFPYNLHNILSSDLNTLQSWAGLWSISFNASRHTKNRIRQDKNAKCRNSHDELLAELTSES